VYMRTRLRNNERGAALLETAITIPIILLICVGIFEFGRAYQTWQVLTNAAREGARVAILSDKLMADGHSRARSEALAILCTSAMQGALIQARVERSGRPIEVTAGELARLLERAADA